jgi:hypothetical protein
VKQKIFPDSKISSLFLVGPWLGEAGFAPGDKAQVTIYPKALVIRKLKNDKDEKKQMIISE